MSRAMAIVSQQRHCETVKSINRKRSVFLLSAGFIFLLAAMLAYHEVDNSLTQEDREYIPKYIGSISTTPPMEQRAFKDELAFIEHVQDAVLKTASLNEGIPFDSKREPKELFLAKKGLCYDKSRVIEKILRYSGFKTRHISIYSTTETQSALKSFWASGTPSHAVTEVWTSKGWLVVDSNEGLGNQPLNPFSIVICSCIDEGKVGD